MFWLGTLGPCITLELPVTFSNGDYSLDAGGWARLPLHSRKGLQSELRAINARAIGWPILVPCVVLGLILLDGGRWRRPDLAPGLI